MSDRGTAWYQVQFDIPCVIEPKGLGNTKMKNRSSYRTNYPSYSGDGIKQDKSTSLDLSLIIVFT